MAGEEKEQPFLASSAVKKAAFYIQDAIDGVKRIHPRDGQAARRAFVIHLKIIPYVQNIAWLFCMLTFVERPLWCNQPEMRRSIDMPCQNEMYPSYPVVYLTVWWNLCLEVLFIIPLAAHSLLQRFIQGEQFWTNARQRARCGLVVIYLADMLYGYLTPVSFFRLAPFLRLGFVVLYSSEVRQRLLMVAKTLPEVLSIFAMIFCFIAFFAWIGVLMFDPNSPEGQLYFPDLAGGMWSLYILMTTANFPDVMMPIYRENRFAILFFFVFIVLGVFFLSNVLTAVVFNVYNTQMAESKQHMKGLRKANLDEAFKLLSTEQVGVTSEGHKAKPSLEISQDTITEVFMELNHYKNIAFITEDDAKTKFINLDRGGTNTVTAIEFASLAQVLRKQVRKAFKPPVLERNFPKLKDNPAWLRLKQVVHHERFDHAIDFVLLLNAVVMVAETWGAITGQSDARMEEESLRWQSVEICIAIVYVGEACLKILVDGFGKYWNLLKNKFDLLVTIATTTTVILVFVPNSFEDSRIIRYISMLRLLRITRLLLVVQETAVVLNTFVKMLPQACAVGKVLLSFVYCFGVVGNQLFGGVINTDPNSPYFPLVNGTAFAEADYYANNFNDMPSAMATLFELVVVNNWFVLAEGFGNACGRWAYAYFVIFHILCVVICFNIVLSLVVNTFVEGYKPSSEDDDDEHDHDLPSLEG